MTNTVTMIPIAMAEPTKEHIYAPSVSEATVKIRWGKVPFSRFSLLVSLHPDGKSDPQVMDIYTLPDGVGSNMFIMKP